MAKIANDGERSVANNRRARHDYFIEETCEAGLALTGTEIKSVRAGRVNLRDGFARVENGEVWLTNVHVAPYQHGGRENHEPLRKRKLLLHRDEIARLTGKVEERGMTLIPLRMYIRRNRAKVELGLGRGKRLYDKRQDIAAREATRQIQRVIRRTIE